MLAKKGNFTLFCLSIIFTFSLIISVTEPAEAVVLSVEDELTMTEMVKNSNSISELKLHLRLFPYTPYQKVFEQRIFKLDNRETYDSIYRNAGKLTTTDEVVMSRLVKNSRNPRELKLFIKLFPRSKFRPVFEERLKRTRKRRSSDPISEEETESHKEIEEKLLAELADKRQVTETKKVEPTKSKEQAKAIPSEKNEKKNEETPPSKEEEKSEPEEDWGKFEVGIPIKLTYQNSNGTEQDNSGALLGVYLGWSHELWLDMGGGTALEYFSQELPNNLGQLQHLYFEAQIRGRLFNIVNWGIGFGNGLTTYQPNNKTSGEEYVPGSGLIKSFSVGLTYGSFGVNYQISEFTGSYQKVTTSSTANTTWSGSLNMLTLEYLY